MGTMTIDPKREITVHTEQSVFLLRESSLFQPSVESCSGMLAPVFATTALDMVDGQKFKMRFAATDALPPVGGNDSFFQLPVVLLEVLLAVLIDLLFFQDVLPVFGVVVTTISLLFLG